jgi:hypothetical protein
MFAEKRFSQSEKQIEEILQIPTHLISKKSLCKQLDKVISIFNKILFVNFLVFLN